MIIACGSVSQTSVGEDKTDLGLPGPHLRRRRTKITAPIATKTAPAMTPPTIAPTFLSCVLCDGEFVGVGLTMICLLGILREVPIRNEKI